MSYHKSVCACQTCIALELNAVMRTCSATDIMYSWQQEASSLLGCRYTACSGRNKKFRKLYHIHLDLKPTDGEGYWAITAPHLRVLAGRSTLDAQRGKYPVLYQSTASQGQLSLLLAPEAP